MSLVSSGVRARPLPTRSPKRCPMASYCSHDSITWGRISVRSSSYLRVGILQVLPIVLLMGHDGLNIERLLLEIRAGDEPVLVAADVEDERAGSSGVIGGREGPLDLREMLPTGVPRKGQKSGQWLACGGMLLGELFRRRFAQNRHIQMFPYLGTDVKGRLPACGNPCEIQPRRPLLDNAANTFSHRHTHDIAWRIQIENDNRQLMFAAHGDRRERKS